MFTFLKQNSLVHNQEEKTSNLKRLAEVSQLIFNFPLLLIDALNLNAI